MTTREINIKPSCMSEIHGIPASQTAQLWEKINYLVDNPLPEGKLKKKLKGTSNIYRLRVGDYRVFYTFGDTWVRLLGIRKRDERTYSDKLTTIVPDAPAAPRDNADDDLDVLLAADQQPRAFQFDPQPKVTALPRPITPDWLKELKVPAAYFPILCSCTSEESLLGAAIPSEVTERVIDNLFPRPLTEVVQQPDLVVQNTADLVRYKDGNLIAFLLKLDDDQKRLTEWALKGPTMVKGGAGTGKSTVALYRVKALLERAESTGSETVLFATYTRALISASRQLLQQLLSPEQFDRVRVATCDEIALEVARKYVNVSNLESSDSVHQVLRTVRQDFLPTGPSGFDRRVRKRSLDVFSDRYLLEEFDWIIDGRELKSLDEYQDAARPGRGCAFRPSMREAVWELHQAFMSELKKRGITRFSDIRSCAVNALRSGRFQGRYDYVIVDEVQDLTPTALNLMAELSRTAEGLFFASDNKQSLYSRNYTWLSVHPRLQFKGRTAILNRNYRSTGEIDRAAFDLLEPEEGESLERTVSVHSGPLPVLVNGTPIEDEPDWAARFIRQMSRHLRMKVSSSAVLVPNQDIGERFADSLTRAGVPAKFFSGRELDLNAEQVKVITLHSAKGLEFPIVVVCGFETGSYPINAEFADPNLFSERMRNERRLLYVGLSRAMRGLLVVVSNDCEHEALVGLNMDNWHLENVH